MNERIKQLAQQTDIWCDQNYPNNDYYDLRWEEKFAELIVLECVRKIDDMIDDGWYADTNELKKHFGVK